MRERILISIVLFGGDCLVAMNKDVDEVSDALQRLVGFCWTCVGFVARGSITVNKGVDSMFQPHLARIVRAGSDND